MEKINTDIDICSTSGAKSHNVLNLTPNPSNKEDSYSLDVHFEVNIGPMKQMKGVFGIKKTCDQTPVCEESDEREKKGMNENRVENSGERISNINLKIVNKKASDMQNYAICVEIVDNTTVKNIKYD